MSAKTWWIIGAILVCAVLREPIVTLLVLLVLVIPPLLKLLGLAHDAESGAYRTYHDKYMD